MLLIRKLFIAVCAFALATALFNTNSFAGSPMELPLNNIDSPPVQLPYPIKDSRSNGLNNNSGIALRNPSNVNDSVVFNPLTKTYVIYQKIGGKFYRQPTTYSFEEFWAMRSKQAEQEYFRKRANTTFKLNSGKLNKPKLALSDRLFNRLFGSGKIDIAPQGNVDIQIGHQLQRIDNPTLPERARRNGGLDFNVNANVNVNASIGDKLKFPIAYNTLANFNLDNQIKLDFSGNDDDIIKRFEAGTVNFASKGQLIPGAQQLFGLKTQLQFGKLFVTTILANQRSQRQSVALQGAAAATNFEIKADEYEENRHFLMGQYFVNTYNKSLANAPAIVTPVQILKLQVWVTNRNGSSQDTRDIVALQDLGETSPYRTPPTINVLDPRPNPSNATNDLLARIKLLPNYRNPSEIFSKLKDNLGLQPVQDFEKTFARKLDPQSYTFNERLGTLSLSSPLQPDEVLGVAYQYTFNGKIFQVGEFSEDVPPDTSATSQGTQRTMFVKLLKATSQRVNLPTWKLMMKNVYSVGYGTLSREDFKLDVLYEEPGLGAKRYFAFGNKNKGQPILSLINLDRLNNQNDPQPDGVFDYIDSFTVNAQYSRIMFPVLEPFGRDLAPQVYTNPNLPSVQDTLFYALYDSIKAVAQQYPNQNRFILRGSAKTTGGGDISLGYNIPKGSVQVTAGGRVLQEGIDYDINYDLGTIKVINPAITNAGVPLQVNFENNAAFGLQQRSFMGLRLDYLAKNTAREQLSIGATAIRLSERPFFTKVNLGEDPIRNAMYGLDVSYRKDMPRLTKLLDKLPFYNTTAPSSVNAYGEFAMLDPGHAPQIGKGSEGTAYIDDFEGTKAGIDLRFPAVAWGLASTPSRFPEAALNNNLDYGKNRAKLAWYQIEQILQQPGANNNPITDRNLLSDPRVRPVYQKEIFPQRTTNFGEAQLQTFDLAFYPRERGPYNYDNSATGVDPSGQLRIPNSRWGGLMRNIDQTDFETANIEFLEAWVQDPFINNPSNPGGKLVFNLGNLSEDVLKDGKRFYENGLPTPNGPAPITNSVWGKIPNNPNQVTNAFSNDPADRPFQDVGLDGLSDTAERRYYEPYLNGLAANLGASSPAVAAATADPSSDNYQNYRNNAFTPTDGLLRRYKNLNSPQGNSPISSGQFNEANTLYPDAEDFNRDNTLNEVEEYYEYEVQLRQSASNIMQVGNNYIVDKKIVNVALPNGTTRNETWYQFRIPVSQFTSKVGNIPDFKSIRFIRMYMTDFADTTVVRFGALQLARNIWRRYKYELNYSGINTVSSGSPFNVGAVNIEENDLRDPLPYRTPRDIQRQQSVSNNGVNLLQNEQSLVLQFTNLKKGDAKAVFQTFANRDLRQFKKMKMYIHSEKTKDVTNNLQNKDLTAIIRIGQDMVSNFYEIRIPLFNTGLNNATKNADSDEYNDSLWNPLNSLDVDLVKLTRLKQDRNFSGAANQVYSVPQPNGHVYSVLGNPNLSEIKGILIGVENTNATPTASAEVWVNELRMVSLDERKGYAALARADFVLADLGTLSVSGNMHTAGFGTLEQRVNERYRDNFKQFDVTAQLDLGKLTPKKAGLVIPVAASYNQTVSSPEYDPYDKDITLKDKIKAAPQDQKDSIRKTAVEFSSTKSVAFTNVKKNKTNGKKPKIYDVSNLDFSYSYLKLSKYSPLIEYNDVTKQRAVVGYNFAPQPKYVQPFKNLFKKSKTKWGDIIKDFNFNLVPSQIAIRADLTRQFGAIKPRSIGGDQFQTPETYDKYMVFQRDYIVRYNPTRSISIDYTAVNNSRVDEPFGRIDTKAKKDSVWRNLLKGGRNTTFAQMAAVQYTLPINKIPLLDFVQANVKYQTKYNWIGASRLAVNLGNIIENQVQSEGTLQMDFTRLYQKSKWLRQLDNPSNKEDKQRWKNRWTKLKDSVTNKKGQRVLRTRKILDKGAMPYVSTPLKVIGKLLTSVKQGQFSISENYGTRLPGYMDSTQSLGQNFRSMNPGFDFILGKQIDSNWLNRKAAGGLLSRDSNFNALFRQNFDQQITASLTLEPIRDFAITVNLKKSFSKNYTETFRFDTIGGFSTPTFQHLTPYSTGSFDVSYIAFKTLFDKFDPNQVSETFRKFESNRLILSERLGKQNPYSIAGGGQQANGYYYGYGRYSVDVLIPSFIAAYTGQDPNSVALIKQGDGRTRSNPFKAILPKPNWNITYSGLSRMKGLDKIFTNFTLQHGYTGSLSMNSFASALLYQDVSRFGYPSFYDPEADAFVPYFLVPNISIQEQFSPLIGIDMQFTNQLTTKFAYAKSRTLSLSLYDYQISETRSTEYNITAGWRKRGLKLFGGLKLPKILGGGGNKLTNEINFNLDFRIRDNVNSNSRLGQDLNFATGGSKEITIRPDIQYTLNNRIGLKFYYDRTRILPYISSSAPTTNRRAGLQITIGLSQ
jgi:cell surface protein SprA